MSIYGNFSGPFFPVFGLNTGKFGPEKTLYLNTFHAVEALLNDKSLNTVLGGECYFVHLSFILIVTTYLTDYEPPFGNRYQNEKLEKRS